MNIVINSQSIRFLLQQVVDPIAATQISLDTLIMLLGVEQHILDKLLEIAFLLADHIS
jgi:hypothetical protein